MNSERIASRWMRSNANGAGRFETKTRVLLLGTVLWLTRIAGNVAVSAFWGRESGNGSGGDKLLVLVEGDSGSVIGVES
jgi:hypothetical protein